MYETSFSGQLKPRWTRRRGMGWVWRREMRSSWSKASFKHCERHKYCIVIHGCHWTRVTGIYWWYESLSCSLNHPVDCSVKWSMSMLEVTLRRCKIVAIKGHKALKQWLIGAGNTTHLTPWYWAWTVDVLVCSFMLLWANLWAYVQPQQNAFWEACHLSTVRKRGYLSYCSLRSINSGSPSQGEMTLEKLKMCWHDTENVLKSVG